MALGHYQDLTELHDVLESQAYMFVRVLRRLVNTNSVWLRQSALEDTREWLRDLDPKDTSV